MPKNKIQFQKGLSLPEFLARYSSEGQCRDSLFKLRWPKGFVCPKCGHAACSEIQSRQLYQCRACRFQASLIQGTIFSATKLPLTTWMLGIYLITQSKDGISSLNLARSLGISANAALRMKHKLQQTMKNRDDQYRLAGNILIDDAYWGGKKGDGKRGRGATGKMPFVAALSLTEEGFPLFIKFNQVQQFTLKEISAWSVKYIRPGSSVLTDGLGCFPGVAAAGCKHDKVITYVDGRYANGEMFKWLNIVLGNVKNALHGTYHAMSDRHLPRYLAEFCYRFNRRFRLDTMVEQLASVALKTSPIPQRLLKLAEVRW